MEKMLGAASRIMSKIWCAMVELLIDSIKQCLDSPVCMRVLERVFRGSLFTC